VQRSQFERFKTKWLRVKDSLSIIILRVRGDHYVSLISLQLGYLSAFIPVYEILSKVRHTI